MKKNGFTLAEVLLSLAIVGIIAAVTLPSLLLNVESKKAGPALMKAVNTIESAATLALQMKDARRLDEIKKGSQGNLNLVADVLPEFTKLIEIPYNPKSGETLSGETYATKDGIVLIGYGKIQNFGPAQGAKISCYKVDVDTNASRGPNKWGKDLFTLYVLPDGTVVPHGSFLYAKKFGGETWESKCKSMTKEDKAKPEDEKYCAGSIIDNGGRVLYYYDKI